MKHLVFVLVVIMISGMCSAEDFQVIFATGEWAPFTSETSPEYGAATALVSAICEAGGIRPVYKFFPWLRAETMVADGKVFAAFPYAITAERKKSFDFSEVLYSAINVFLYSTNNPETREPAPYQTLGDLHGYRIGGIRGGLQEPVFQQAGLDYEATTTIEQSILKLDAGRIDLCFGNSVVLYDAIQRLFPEKKDQFQTLPKPYGENMPVALLVSRAYQGRQEILEKFHEGLAIIKQNGEYDRITEKYHMTKAE